jgi:hypothetical protein
MQPSAKGRGAGHSPSIILWKNPTLKFQQTPLQISETMNTILSYLPPKVRKLALTRLQGQRAIRFPASYSLKIKGSRAWVLLAPMDSDGMVIKTHPYRPLMDEVIAWLHKNKVDFQVFTINAED